MSETVQELWKYEVGDRVSAVAIKDDGQFNFAGSNDGHVYCFYRPGDLY